MQGECYEDDVSYLEVVGEIQKREVGDDGTLDDVVECEVKGVTTCSKHQVKRKK